MKPAGPIPQGYQCIDGEIAIGGVKASELADRAGQTPLFVYSKALLDARVAALREAMPEGLGINFAVKANPLPALIAHMAGLVDGFDVASAGELTRVLEAGVEAGRISFAGPGKRDFELEAAIAAGATLNCESEAEARRALKIADRLGKPAKLAIRVNPDFELRGSGMKMGGGAKPFGLDAERVPDLAREIIAAGALFKGLHIFTGSQSLDSEALIETQGNVLKLAEKLSNEIGRELPKLNMGGGFGIAYFDRDRPLDIAAIGAALGEKFSRLPAALRDTEFCIELGRYLVGEAGIYLCRIVDRKESHGQIFLITDGGLHHQLAASGNFGTVVRRNYPIANATKYSAEADEEANVVGCLCTPLDRLGDAVMLPKGEVGDLIAVFCAGAYGASASPSAFLGHGPAPELLI